jgi:branched-chain amino acid transport system ATP-binding protein
MSLLSLTDVGAAYGSSQALFGVSLEIGRGEALALIGRNGMGKTTTVRAICGMLPASGTLVFDGHDLSHLPSHRAARLGIGLVPEGRRCFRDLTVEENLLSAARKGHWDLARVTDLFPRLGERRRQRAALLSGGEQQMLAIGRALMTNPRLLIMDEATEGLSPLVRQEIWSVIGTLKSETGMTLMVIDKSLRELRTACDHAVILERGRSVWAGPFPAMGGDVVSRYLGL